MNAAEERYPYRLPWWFTPVALVMCAVFWSLGTDLPVVLRALFWLIALFAAVAAVASLISLGKRFEVVLTDHLVAATSLLRQTDCINFTSVDSLQIDKELAWFGQGSEYLDIRAPGQHIRLWNKAFEDQETFESVVSTIVARVQACGGPALEPKPRSRFSGSFVG